MSPPIDASGAAGETAISPDEERFLKLAVRNRRELNLAERDNINLARLWLFAPRRRLTVAQILDPILVRDVHRRMFSRVWKWAGIHRDIELNIGVPSAQVQPRLYSLLGDTQTLIDHLVYAPDEICVRLHHGLVVIHPWRNGNGRHARLIADRLAAALSLPRLTWGGGAELTASTDTREKYLSALRLADQNDFKELIRFAKS